MTTAGVIFAIGVIVWLLVALLVLGLCHAAANGDENLLGWDEWDEPEVDDAA